MSDISGRSWRVLKALQIGYKPRETRHPVLIPARMRVGQSWIEVVIHNLSSGGALVASDEAPERGTYIEIRRGRQTIIGRSEEHTSELQSLMRHVVCRLLLEKKKYAK